MTLWIAYGAVLKSSSQWQLKEFLKLNNSGHDLKLSSADCFNLDLSKTLSSGNGLKQRTGGRWFDLGPGSTNILSED